MSRRSWRASLAFFRRHRTGLSVLLLALPLSILPVVVTNPFLLGIGNQIGIYALAAFGLNLFVGYCGQISLGHAAFMGLGAYGSGWLATSLSLSPWLATPLAALASAACAWLIGLPAIRLRGHHLAMATLGFNYALHVILIQWDRVTGGASGLSGIPGFSLGRITLESDARFHYLVWALVVGALGLLVNLVRSGAGRRLAAVAQDETAAASFGIDVGALKLKTFVLSAALASLAGSLYAHYHGYVHPDSFSVFTSLEMVIMVVIGGLGSLWGSLLGAAFVTSLPHFLGRFEMAKEVIHGIILVSIMIFMPRGLLYGLADLLRTAWAHGKTWVTVVT